MRQEFDIIERLRRAARQHRSVSVGIGDDTTVLHSAAGSESRSLVTVDLLAEGTHFLIPPATPRLVGRKALAVNLSDIAAMAGQPDAAFTAVLLPRQRGSDFAEELLAGVQELAAEFDVCLAGGDTNIWDGPLVISITLIGRPTGRGPVLRSTAQPGDRLFVTGPLGGSFAGRHLTFTPRVAEAQALHRAVDLHALIDLSDGLSRDIRHLTTEQGTGFELEAERIPIHEDVPHGLPWEDRLARALHDGEDFELLFAVSPEDARKLIDSPPPGLRLTPIGTVTDDPRQTELVFADGRRETLEPRGYEHRFSS